MSSPTSYASTYEFLSTSGFESEQPLMPRHNVTVKEKGQHYKLKVSGQEPSVVYAVDGKIITKGTRCDKLLLVNRCAEEGEPEQWTEIFVELKGVDTSHAITQLRETLKHTFFKHPSNKEIRARIVAKAFPSNKADPTMERAKREFRQTFNCDLRGMKAGQEDQL